LCRPTFRFGALGTDLKPTLRNFRSIGQCVCGLKYPAYSKLQIDTSFNAGGTKPTSLIPGVTTLL